MHAHTEPGSRRAAIVLLAVFITLLGLPGAYQLLYGFRGGELARWRGWLRGEQTAADAFRRIEEDLNARFFLATTINHWRADLSGKLPMSETPRESIVDRETDYLFVDSDAAVPRAAGLMTRRLDKPLQAIAALADLHAKLRDRGIHLIVVPIVPKASIYPDKLEPGYDVANGPDLNVEHREWFAALGRAGVDVVDLADAFWAARARERTDASAATFTRFDSHWTWHGVAIAADAIAARAAPHLAGVPRVAGLERKIVRRSRPNDLLRKIDGQPPETEFEDRAYLLDADGRTVRAADLTSPIVVLGDSFAAGFVDEGSGLPQAIEFAAGVAARSAPVYGGSVATMRRPLADPGVMTKDVRVVVLAFAMRHLITSDWPTVPVNVAPR